MNVKASPIHDKDLGYDMYKYNLVIVNIENDDYGTYECEIGNGIGQPLVLRYQVQKGENYHYFNYIYQHDYAILSFNSDLY